MGTRSEELFQRAVKRIPGGVNSPVRAYGSVEETPRFIQGLPAVIFLMQTAESISIIFVPGVR